MKRLPLLVLLPLMMQSAWAQEFVSMALLPKALLSHIDAGTKVRDFKTVDLNGDSLDDYLLVIEREDGTRTLKIITKQANGQLLLAKSNDAVVYCRDCGGALGDPFESISTKSKSFTVRHFGGSGYRWSVATTFNYSRRDQTWQLVRVEESEFHVQHPDQMERQIYTPPKHFGKIDFADFDPNDFKGRGEK